MKDTQIDYKSVFNMILRTALTVPIALSIALVILGVLFFLYATITLIFYVGQLEKTRLENLAQAEKDGLSVYHSLEYGWKNGVVQHPLFFKSTKQKDLETTPLEPEEIIDSISGAVVGSPLDQFAIHPYIPLHMGNFYFSFTNLSLSMLLTLVLVLVGFVFYKKRVAK